MSSVEKEIPAIVISVFSEPQASVLLTTSGTLDPTLPSITVPSGFFPRGMQLVRVEAILMFRKVVNTNASDNKLSGTQYVQVQKGSGALANAIKFVDDELAVDGDSEGPGDAIIGSIDIKSTVDADGATYNFQWTDALTDADSLVLHDVRMGLRFYFG